MRRLGQNVSDHFLACRYKSLKKYLKYRLLNSEVNGDGGNSESMEEEKDFLRLLYAQLKGVDRYFLIFKHIHSIPSTVHKIMGSKTSPMRANASVWPQAARLAAVPRLSGRLQVL